MAKNLKRVAIILPAYNEGKIIGKTLDQLLHKVAGNKDYDISIIVVNDGSADNTATEVKKRKSIILINHIINSGVGAATRTGFHYAKDIGCDYALTMDSDGQHASQDVMKLIDEIAKNKSDFIIGSRLTQSNGNMPAVKKIGNLGLSVITFILLGVYVSDSQSGLKVMNARALRLINFHSDDYAFCSEMIWRARQAKLKITEFPIEAIYTDYSMSKGQENITGALEIIKQLIKRRFLSFINE